MTRDGEDTIFALSSGRPPAAIAVVRISGRQARAGIEALARRVPEPRRAALATLRDPSDSEAIDSGLVLWIPGPASETGEDMAELHLHGGRAIVAKVFEVLGRLPGFRPAVAGEFTRRALFNGKIDLAGVEGLGDLIAAETEAQRRQALAQYRGALSARVERWRERLIEAMAQLEASIDFCDEGDVPEDLLTPVGNMVRELAEEIGAALADARRGERLREGLVVAVVGPPNAGKSTLVNCLAQREVAIVSATPGTTRDPIEVALDLAGVPVVLVDTAGVREAKDEIEGEGVRRALARAESADLVLWLVEADEDVTPPPESVAQTVAVVAVRTKADLVDSDLQRRLVGAGAIVISAKTGKGIDELIARLAQEAEGLGGGEPALVTRARQRHALEEALERLKSARAVAVAGKEEILGEELRLAANALARISGRVGVEEVLGEIFRNFCVGK
jgi:tRNA modification GTPase